MIVVIGDFNGKGLFYWNSMDKKWGVIGMEIWFIGLLDLINVVNWILGEYKLEFKEIGGVGGDLKVYIYVIYFFSKSILLDNNICGVFVLIDFNIEVVVFLGIIEDFMGKILVSDDS